MAIVQGIQEISDQIRPIRFLEIGNRSQVPAPFLRIMTCGLLSIEVVNEIVSTDPPLARYISLTSGQLRGRGTAPALTLLKLFLSRSERFALKEWLMDAFCHDRELFSNVRLDNIVSQLRSMLCPPEYADLRTHLVTHLRGSTGSGDGYQLAAYPLIWVDSEALDWYVEQAVRMERFGDDPLPYWEQAYELARRGPFSPDEAYGDWSRVKREEIAGLLRQSVQALARLYLVRHGELGEEEALLLLRSYWLDHPFEEDVLRSLMELLGQRERYHEALGYYQQLCTILEQENHRPDKQTQDLAEYLCEKQIQRVPQRNLLAKPAVFAYAPFEKAPLLEVEETAKARFQGLSPENRLLDPSSDWPYLMSNPSRMEIFQQFSSSLMYSSSLDKTLLELLEQQTRMLWQHREALNMPLEMFYRQVNDHLAQLKTFLEYSLLQIGRASCRERV